MQKYFLYARKNTDVEDNPQAFPAPLARLCAKHRASAKAEVRETLCTPHNLLKRMWCAEMQMRNASEILRNAGGLGESISQNSLRVLPDFLAGFWRGRLWKTKSKNGKIFL